MECRGSLTVTKNVGSNPNKALVFTSLDLCWIQREENLRCNFMLVRTCK